MTGPVDLPLHWLRIPPPVPAGMNPLVLCSIAYDLRTSCKPVNPPIRVQQVGAEDFVIVDGRHRWLGSLIAGRTHISALVSTST